jgi:hypothetical protein
LVGAAFLPDARPVAEKANRDGAGPMTAAVTLVAATAIDGSCPFS